MKARERLSGYIVDVIEYHDEAEPMFQYREHKLYGTNKKYKRSELEFIDENDWDNFLKETSGHMLAQMISTEVAKKGDNIDIEEEPIKKFAIAAVKYTNGLINELKKKYR